MAKTKMSKKKKIIIAAVCVFMLLLVSAAGVGAYELNRYCQPISVKQTQVADNPEVKLIAHRGFSAIAPENTLPAYEEAGRAGFWGSETDIYRTTDGKWVLMHDNYLYRLMKDSFLEKVDSMTYDELMEFVYDNGANIQNYPDLHVSTLEEYLDVCKKYEMTPVIEYKSKKNYEYLHEVVEIIRSKGMESQCVIISFQLDALQEFGKYTDIMPLWYLLKETTEEDINDALALGANAGIDFNANNGKTSDEMIKLAIDKGLQVGCWTVDDPAVMNRMVDLGVKHITTNTITPSKELA